ncbi:MAG: hypothetical protein FJ146_10995 [Deltaproteobacteria bacterium]|nr:hypothetical protein [Deltaproteobacteria bacterium]
MSGNKNKHFNLRKQHNSDLIRRMRNGEPLNTIDSKSSWYPPRPVIKKDESEMARVYGTSVTEKAQELTLSAVQDGDVAAITRFRAS